MRRATLLGASAIPMWATLAAVAQRLHRLPPFATMALAFGIAAAVSASVSAAGWAAGWVAASGVGGAAQRGAAPSLRLRPLAWVWGVGGLAGYHALYFLAFRLAPSAPVQINLLNYLWPLLIVLGSVALDRATLSGREIGRALLGALAGFAGALLLVGTGGGAVSGPAAAAAVGAAGVWAAYSVAGRWFQDVPSSAVGAFCGATALLSAALHLALEAPSPLQPVWPNASEVPALLWAGLCPLGAAFFAWDYGCKHGDVRVLGVAAYATPLLSTLILAAVVSGGGGGESGVPPATWGAAALILGGAALTARGR